MKQSLTSGNIYDVFDTQSQEYRLHRLPEAGRRIQFDDGREFVFVNTAVNVAAGQLVGAPNAIAELEGKFTVASVGDETITITIVGATANLYAGGYIVITESSGNKSTYYIMSNTASDGSNNVILRIAGRVSAAIAAADDAIIVPSRYNSVIVNTATTDPVGVALVASTAATDGYTNYLWVQTKGVGGVVVATAAGLTKGVGAMAAAAGSVAIANGTLPFIGTMLAASAVSNSDVAPIMLRLP